VCECGFSCKKEIHHSVNISQSFIHSRTKCPITIIDIQWVKWGRDGWWLGWEPETYIDKNTMWNFLRVETTTQTNFAYHHVPFFPLFSTTGKRMWKIYDSAGLVLFMLPHQLSTLDVCSISTTNFQLCYQWLVVILCSYSLGKMNATGFVDPLRSTPPPENWLQDIKQTAGDKHDCRIQP